MHPIIKPTPSPINIGNQKINQRFLTEP